MRASLNRRGVGVVFVFIMGMIVVLSIFLVSQFFSGRATTSEAAVADLGNRAEIVAESATEECAYFTMKSANDREKGDAEGAKLYERLRKFTGASSTVATQYGPTGKGLPYLWTVKYGVPRTKAFYSNNEATGDVELSDFVIGPLSQAPFPDAPAKSNESFGILGFEGEVTVHSKTGGSDVTRKVQFAKNFRVLLLHAPFPFNQYTLFVKRGSVGTADRFHEYFDQYQSAVAAGLSGVADFPVSEMASDERPVVTTASEIRSDQFVIAGLDPAAGLNYSSLPSNDLALLNKELNNMKQAGFAKLDASTAAEYVNDGYYRQLTWQALKNKASHYYPDFGRFVYDVADGDELKLSGFYYIEKGLVLNHRFSGRAVIVTSSTEDVVIRRLEKSEPHARLCVITVNSDFDFQVGSGTDLTFAADLLAPNGTIKNAGNAKIAGCVYLDHVETGSQAGPWILRPDDTAAEPWESGELDDAYAQKLGIFLSPGYTWKRYWSNRSK